MTPNVRSATTRPWTVSLCLAAATLLSACLATTGGGASTATAEAKVPPGMNAQGEVIEPRNVQAGHGQKVKGEGGWEGEITGKLAPGSRFGALKIGMTASQAQAMLGPPSDFGAHTTAKNFIPFYMGADKARYEAVYKGQGRLLFASSGGAGNDQMHLIWIIHSAREDGKR